MPTSNWYKVVDHKPLDTKISSQLHCAREFGKIVACDCHRHFYEQVLSDAVCDSSGGLLEGTGNASEDVVCFPCSPVEAYLYKPQSCLLELPHLLWS